MHSVGIDSTLPNFWLRNFPQIDQGSQFRHRLNSPAANALKIELSPTLPEPKERVGNEEILDAEDEFSNDKLPHTRFDFLGFTTAGSTKLSSSANKSKTSGEMKDVLPEDEGMVEGEEVVAVLE